MKAIVAAFFCLLTGCATQPQSIQITVPFDEQQAQLVLNDGTNNIYGNALLRQQGGGIVTCAGTKVYLYPATAYASARIAHIYKSTSSGYLSFRGAYSKPNFVPDHPLYHTYSRETVCDSQGNFSFESMPDGDFYIIASVVWRTGGQYDAPQGGTLMQRVSVYSSQTKKIVMTY